MADDGDRRVEPRTLLVGRGSGATPEKIADLQRRVDEVERAHQLPPAKSFSAVLAKASSDRSEGELSDKERKLGALPKTGPRPGLLHPSQRSMFGRVEETKDVIVLKG